MHPRIRATVRVHACTAHDTTRMICADERLMRCVLYHVIEMDNRRDGREAEAEAAAVVVCTAMWAGVPGVQRDASCVEKRQRGAG